MASTSTERVRRYRERNRLWVRYLDRARKAKDREMYKRIFGVTHKERVKEKQQ